MYLSTRTTIEIGNLKLIDIKRAVSENRKVKFKYFRDNILYYETEYGEIFPVPVSDTDQATFNAEDKALYFMRWMKKFNKDNS